MISQALNKSNTASLQLFVQRKPSFQDLRESCYPNGFHIHYISIPRWRVGHSRFCFPDWLQIVDLTEERKSKSPAPTPPSFNSDTSHFCCYRHDGDGGEEWNDQALRGLKSLHYENLKKQHNYEKKEWDFPVIGQEKCNNLNMQRPHKGSKQYKLFINDRIRKHLCDRRPIINSSFREKVTELLDFFQDYNDLTLIQSNPSPTCCYTPLLSKIKLCKTSPCQQETNKKIQIQV